MTSLRVALLDHGQDASIAQEVATSLQVLGHDAAVIGGRATILDVLLSRRGFTTPLSPIPGVLRELARGHYDIAHAFSPASAYAALLWRRRSGIPVVFSCTGPIERERLADRRLRLRFLRTALEESDAVIVHDAEARAPAWRWLALELPVIAPAAAAEHEHLYRRLLAAQA